MMHVDQQAGGCIAGGALSTDRQTSFTDTVAYAQVAQKYYEKFID